MSKVNFPKWLVNDAIDSGFSAGLMRKDLHLATELADRLGVDLDGFAPIAHI
ncbi:MAG: NAD-binding protein [Geminicoccaceae bacterium]